VSDGFAPIACEMTVRSLGKCALSARISEDLIANLPVRAEKSAAASNWSADSVISDSKMLELLAYM
jgi:hypothetical protein